MVQNEFLPNVWTYNMLINGLCGEGDEMENFKVFQDLVYLRSNESFVRK